MGAKAIAEALKVNSTIYNLLFDIKLLGEHEDFDGVTYKLRANKENFESAVDSIRPFVKQIAEGEGADLLFAGLKSRSSSILISSKNYEYIVEHKTVINRWLTEEMKTQNIKITTKDFWHALEVSKNTTSLEQGIFDILDLPLRYNIMVSNLYPYAKEVKQLYCLFRTSSQSKIEEDIATPEEPQETNQLYQFKERYVTIVEDDGNFIALWQEFITYAGKLFE
ncbi:MAG: hypothetical protein ACRYE9_03030 [Janthinobacterium lividum]